jgi:glutathione S-transferase
MLTLHHLETSRSSRVIWLLEALGLEYELVVHKRGSDMRATHSLKQVHPLGKAPTIVDGDLMLTESGTILRYIAQRYGQGRFSPAAGTTAAAIHDQWLDYAESSLMMPAMIRLIGRGAGGLPESLDHFSARELDRALDHLGESVAQGPFLMGEELSLADIQMSYCLAVLDLGGFLQYRPALRTYWQRLQADPHFQRAIALGGPLIPQRRSNRVTLRPVQNH